VSLNIPLRNPGIEAASDSARKRARAAMMQRDDALEARRQRIAETHEQTTATLDRARRLGTALRDSDQLRNFTLQQWQQLGRRSLFDVMSAEAEHYNLRVQYVNALHDAQQLNALVWSLSRGVWEWLR
jgi:outer membrane protein TolC